MVPGAIKRLLGGALFVLAAAAPLAAPKAIAAETPYRVMMVLWRGCEDACRGFQDHLRENDVPVDFLMRDLNQDPLVFPKLVAEARSLDVDLVVTWGTTVTLGIVSEYDHVDPDIHLDDIPVLFMVVSDPLESRIVPSLELPGRNVSGTLYLVPEDVQMRAFRSYMPFDKVGMIYNTNEANAIIGVDKIRTVAADQGFELVVRAVPNDRNNRPIPESLPHLVAELAQEGVDLIYLGAASFLVLNRDVLTGAAVELGIPVAAAGEVAVIESQALMGLVSRYYAVGQLTAMRAERILADGEAPGTIPVESLRRFSLVVNMEVARKLDRYPPMSLLNIVEVVETTGAQPR